MNIVRFPGSHLAWNWLRIVVFDCPEVLRRSDPFEKRFSLLLRRISLRHPVITLAGQMECNNYDRILEEEK